MEKYKNKNWLKNQYSVLEQDSYKIAKMCKVSDSNIREHLRKFGVPIRTSAESQHLNVGNHCNITEEAKEFIDGELLGDMCVWSRCQFSAQIRYGTSKKKYLEWLIKQLSCWDIAITGTLREHSYGKYNAYHISSKEYPELLDFRNRFYPNGKKIVPKDIELTPLVVRQWYIGDGTPEKFRPKRSNVAIRFCTYGFTTEDVLFLVQELEKLGFQATKQIDKRIRLSTKSTQDFFDYIGDCPEEIKDIYGYKWLCDVPIGNS